VANLNNLIYKKDLRNKTEFIFTRLKNIKMKFLFLIIILACVSCTHSYYIVRHAERATQGPNMSSDVPLSEAGQQRAEALKTLLQNEKISEIFSTNTTRTRTTAQPTAKYLQKTIQIYGPRPDSAFIQLLKTKRRNVLVVGHSNTVDDIVNMLCGKTAVPGDLKETEYDNLFVVKIKGKKAVLEGRKYGAPTP
jgi:broad specificity phosphatase PhoE